MTSTARQQVILELLERQGACSYRELRDLLRVSMMTVRRDVDALESRRAVIKTLGGVQKADAPAYLYETPLMSRLPVHNAEKRAIALQCMGLLAPGQTVFLDGSTTCLETAKLVAREHDGVTIITNSAFVCLELGRNPRNTVIAIGGQFDQDTGSFVGSTSEEAAGKFFVDLALMSTKGFLPAEGTFESSLANFRIKQIIASHSAHLALLVDHSKFGQRALCKVLDVASIRTIITDDAAPAAEIEGLRAAGKRVLVASVRSEIGAIAAGGDDRCPLRP